MQLEPHEMQMVPGRLKTFCALDCKKKKTNTNSRTSQVFNKNRKINCGKVLTGSSEGPLNL